MAVSVWNIVIKIKGCCCLLFFFKNLVNN